MGAFIAMGIVTLVLGVLLYCVLYFPASRRAKRELQENPNSSFSKRYGLKVTKAGVVVYGIMVAVLFGGLSQEYLAPESELGQLVKTESGKWLFVVPLVVVVGLLEAALKKRGIRLTESKEINNE